MGTPAVTARGFKEEQMEIVGKLICAAAQGDFTAKGDRWKEEALALTARFPLYQD